MSFSCIICLLFFFFQAEDGIRDLVRSRGLGDVYKRQKMKGAIVLTGHPTGCIRVLNRETGIVVVEIGGHSRVINALDVHPTKDMFVTVSEDTYVNVWSLPSETNHQEIGLLLNAQIDSQQLCGVQFCCADQSSIMVSAYDSTQLVLFSPL
eukprot:TRINITY_DN29565_c0_g1_i1.p1 TRINITY_DN29565_c0_g1~~TRINITY_DN29565_c0_g1_i1.p1  ORF type:complete len:151 (+),score=41.00 TRINITY_DN29565_c0_g1_i1:95-547(+)